MCSSCLLKEKYQKIVDTIILMIYNIIKESCLGDDRGAGKEYKTDKHSRATVYRVLNRLVDNGTIQKVGVNRGADHFDHRAHPHYHICCIRCGKVSDVEMPYMAELERQAGDCRGYRVTSCSIQFEGVCPECQRKEKADTVR